MAKDVQKGIIIWLERWEHAGGKERQWLCQKLELQMYAMNGQLTYTVQRWQDQFVDSLPVEMWLTSTQRASQAYFTTGVEGKDKLQNLLEGEFMHYLDYCSQYPEIKDWIDDQIRRGCEVILEHEHSLIGVAVREVLSGFDKKKFNAFLESKVGEDLAWIRINGAIVGGTLGLFVFVILKVIYDPSSLPFIHQLVLGPGGTISPALASTGCAADCHGLLSALQALFPPCIWCHPGRFRMETVPGRGSFVAEFI